MNAVCATEGNRTTAGGGCQTFGKARRRSQSVWKERALSPAWFSARLLLERMMNCLGRENHPAGAAVIRLTLTTSGAGAVSPICRTRSRPSSRTGRTSRCRTGCSLTGWVGMRIEANEANRLVKLDPARLLEGYRKRPGRQSWDGEHVGKWLHAATLAWVNTGDPALRAEARLRGRRIDQVPARRRLPGHLPGEGPLDRMGRVGAQVQPDRPDHLHALHRQPGAAARLPPHGRPAVQDLWR